MVSSSRSEIRGGERIRVAYVIDMLFQPAGGTEGQLLHLLQRLDRRRFDPYVFCLETTPWIERGDHPAPIEVLDIHVGRSPGLPGALRDFSRRLREGGFDVVQTHFRDANIVGVLAASMADTPVILSTRRGVPYWTSPVGLAFLRWLNRKATWYLANSRATRDRFAAEEGWDPAHCDVVYNGLEPERFVPDSPEVAKELRRELGIDPSVPVVGIVANLRAVKGIEDLVRAARYVVDRHPQARFLVAGEGVERPRLEALIRQLGLGTRFRLLGARSDVPQLLSVFDVGVLASHSESFSNSILEYLAADLPVVVTEVGGAREAVEDGENGFVVPPKDPRRMGERIDELLSHPGGPRAWRKAPGIDPRFGLAHMVSAHEQLYERLVAAAREGGGSRTLARS